MTSRYPGGLIRKNAANTAITGASGVWDLGSQAQAVKNNTWPISGLALPVSGSLRFRAAASPYLNRTVSSTSNRQKFTISVWFKRATFGAYQGLIQSACPNPPFANTFDCLRFNNSDQLEFAARGGNDIYLVPSMLFRDPSAWYHVVVAVDTTQATSTNRVKFYVNGSQISAFASTTYPSQNYNFNGWNVSSYNIAVGPDSGLASQFFDGYMAEINVIDGQQLDVGSFGQTSPITGVWEPIKYTGTYGTNGFYLSLSDTSSIGKDFSGNGNNLTPSNISTTSGATFDLMRDVPTQWAPQSVTDVGGTVRGNYATLNPLWTRYDTNGTFSRGNLQYTGTGSAGDATFTFVESTIAIPENSTGKWYWETQISATTGRAAPGIVGSNFPGGQYGSFSSTLTGNYAGAGAQNGVFYKDGSSVLSGQTGGGTANDYAMFAYDASSGKLWYGVNGTWWNSGAPASGTGQVTTLSTSLSWFPSAWVQSSSDSIIFNFGQRPFAYTPPTGFKSLCTTNLPTPTIGATTATAASKYFNTVLYTGTGSTNPITGVGFQPDWVWGKRRNSTGNNWIFDAVRGAGNQLVLNNTNAEVSGSTEFASFDSDGFTVTSTAGAFNASGSTYVAWNWNAGGSTVTNTAGSITSQVRASTTAGFSIATFTGNGTAGATVGHGLGVAPSMIMFKERLTGTSGLVWHTGYGTNQGQMLIDSTAAIYNPGNGLYFNSTYPSSTVVTLGTSGATNGNGSNYVLYSWAAVAGYSAFGSYTGNGSTDGPFIYTGFRPKFVMVKNTVDPNNWTIFDSARNTYNILISQIYPNISDAEVNGSSTNGIDFLSNGFKIRSSFNWGNRSSDTIIYMAFAEHPFKNSLAR